MKLSETIWKLSLVENVRDKLAKIQNAADKTGMHVSNIQDKLGGMGKMGKGAIGEVANSMGGLGMSIGPMLTNPITAVGVAVGAVVVGAAKMGMEFSQSMAKINATAQLPKKDLDELGQKLLNLGKKGFDPQALAGTFEKVNSQVNDVEKSLKITEVAAKGAKAGFGDMESTGAALAQTMSAIGGNADAQDVMDTLMGGKNLGGGEMDDFANYLPGLIAQGKNLGVSFKDTAGAFSFMTARGMDASQSSVLMQNAFTALGKSDIQENMAKIGVNVFDKDGSMRGLDEIFNDMTAKTEGMTDQQKSNLFEMLGLRDSQAKQAFSVLMGDAAGLKEIMHGVKNSAGETERTIQKTANPMSALTEMGNMFKSHLTELGVGIMPGITAAIDFISNNFNALVESAKDFYNNNVLIQDIVSLIGAAFGFVWDIILWIGNKLKWIWDNILRPILDGISWVYNTVKELLGLGGKKLEVKAEVSSEVKTTRTVSTPEKTAKNAGLTTAELGKLKGTKEGDKVDGIHGGGSQQRNIIVTVNKMVEGGINIHTSNIKGTATDLERQMREMLVAIINGAEMAVANG